MREIHALHGGLKVEQPVASRDVEQSLAQFAKHNSLLRAVIFIR
jgi:hypothetical protein